MILDYYAYYSSEPAVFAEVYLPKKSKFQGILYETLTNGFYIEKVKEHFRDKKERIQKLLLRYEDIASYTDEDIDKFPRVFLGYSMYEVDGVFFSENPQKNNENNSDGTIIEERTQVIRIIFKPHLKELVECFGDLIKGEDKERVCKTIAKKFLRHHTQYTNEFLKIYPEFKSKQPIVEYLEKWVDYTGLFMFGYIIYEISDKILDLLDKKEIEKEEDEIWVTSLWNLTVNRVVFKKQSKTENICRDV